MYSHCIDCRHGLCSTCRKLEIRDIRVAGSPKVEYFCTYNMFDRVLTQCAYYEREPGSDDDAENTQGGGMNAKALLVYIKQAATAQIAASPATKTKRLEQERNQALMWVQEAEKAMGAGFQTAHRFRRREDSGGRTNP